MNKIQIYIMRDTLVSVYLDWRNNYLTVDKFAEHNGLSVQQAKDLITLATSVFESQHPES